MLFWLSGLGYSSPSTCGFPPWGNKEELATTWSSPLFSDSQFTTNGEFNLTAAATWISTIAFPWEMKNTIILKSFRLLDLVGVLVDQFSRLSLRLRKSISHSNWYECSLPLVSQACCVSHTHFTHNCHLHHTCITFTVFALLHTCVFALYCTPQIEGEPLYL